MSIFDGIKKKETKPAEVKEIKPKAEVKTAVAKKPVVVNRQFSGTTGVLLAPVISEKAAHLAAAHQYVFHVGLTANKVMVKQAVKSAYKVDAVSVNMIRVEGKTVRRGKTVGKQSDYKKAIVTLKPGQKIEMYEGV